MAKALLAVLAVVALVSDPLIWGLVKHHGLGLRRTQAFEEQIDEDSRY